MAQLRPDMPIFERVQIIHDALAKVLDRGPEMSVEPSDLHHGDLAVYVIGEPYSEDRAAHDLHQIARELEALLS